MSTLSTSTSTSPPSLLHNTLITAPLKVVYNTFYFTTAGVLTGATLGVYRSVPAIPSAFKTGLNTGLFSFTFFSIREYALNPLISLVLPSLRPFPPPLNALPTRSNNVLSTALAGTITGTLVTYFSRGPKGSIKGGGTLGLACVLVQLGVNEAELSRIKMLGWSEERNRVLKELDEAVSTSNSNSINVEESIPPTYTRSIELSSPDPNVPSRETFSERSDRLIGSSFNSFKRFLSRISPVRKMEEGVYEKTLEGKLEVIEKDLESVRDELKVLREGSKDLK